ncbi:MAG: glycoside hydrolase [Chitinophagaceae bacterium]
MKIKLVSGVIVVFLFATVVETRAQNSNTIVIQLDVDKKAQRIDNIGASGCWFSEGIGKNWPQEKKERIAELLFSRGFDKQGNPRGIGLSAWRFNIGGGTTEQGDSSGIKDFRKRVECFLSKDGSYDWNKQSGYQWFLKKAKNFGVEKLIAFSNTPPVQFTENGLGYKTVKDYKANLRPDKYDEYVGFLSEVLQHFDKDGLHFDYISPVNEPQWDWSKKYMEADQEGSPWANEDISNVITKLDKQLSKSNLNTQILFPEAGMLNYLYAGSGQAPYQIQNFFSQSGTFNANNLSHLPKIVAGHSYFTDGPDSNRIAVRKHLADTAVKYGVDFWQSEYCMLADGFREGTKALRTGMDCALFLAKIIHTDFTVANATAWQYWNSYEPGKADIDTRYYLIALDPNKTYTDGNFTVTKNLWALGHFSLFVRPGMYRLLINRSDHSSAQEDAQNVMVSAFAKDKDEIVVVAINYTNTQKAIKLEVKGITSFKKITSYTTTSVADENMKAVTISMTADRILLEPRSINTFVLKR